jgi:hypothetical protein
MMNITLPKELAEQLEAITMRENRPVEDVVASMIEQYEPHAPSQEESDAAFEALVGIYDDDITDMSTTVRETLNRYFQDKYGRTAQFALSNHRDFSIFRPRHCDYLELLP